MESLQSLLHLHPSRSMTLFLLVHLMNGQQVPAAAVIAHSLPMTKWCKIFWKNANKVPNKQLL